MKKEEMVVAVEIKDRLDKLEDENKCLKQNVNIAMNFIKRFDHFVNHLGYEPIFSEKVIVYPTGNANQKYNLVGFRKIKGKKNK